MTQSAHNYAQYIDHTLLAMDATAAQIDRLCDEAKAHHFCAVCVNSSYVPRVAANLQGTPVKVCSVIGFPLGACLTQVKVYEAQQAIAAGAQEIDMVINVGWLKSGEWDAVADDIKQVRAACGATPLKVILETCLLTDEEKVRVCKICVDADVAFVKTSTGFSNGGATLDDVKLMRTTVGPELGVKASGGVRDTVTAAAMIDAGATRIGTSSGIKIIGGDAAASGDY